MTQTWAPILQDLPGVSTYADDRESFTWDRARGELAGLPGDRGSTSPTRRSTGTSTRATGTAALRCVEHDGGVSEMTYAQLRDADQPLRHVLTAWASARATGSDPARAASPSSTSPRSARSSAAASSRRCSPPSGPEPIRERLRLGRARVLVTTPELYRRRWPALRDELPDLEHVLVVGGRRARTRDRSPDGCRPSLRRLHDPADRPGGPRAAALHQRHHRQAQGRRPRARGGGRPSRHRAVRPRPAAPATCSGAPPTRAGSPARRTASSRRSRTAPPLISYAGEFDARRWYRCSHEQHVNVWYTAPTALRMLMRYGADAAAALRPLRAAAHRERRRGTQPRGRHLGYGGLRPADPRQLVADRDRRDHGQQLPRHGDPAGLDGPADARASRRRCSSAARTAGPMSSTGTVAGRRPARPASSRCGRAGPRCSAATSTRRSATAKCFAGGWYLSGDLARARRGRLLLVRRPGRRRDQVRGTPDRPVRGRDRADGAPGGRRGRGDRQAGPGGRRGGQGVRHAEGRLRADRGAAARPARLRPATARAAWRRRRSPSTSTCRTPAAAR